MTEGVCHCGHERFRHGRLETTGARCRSCDPCPGYDDSVLPVDGERLEFGRHRQPAQAAETAPAWPALR